MKICFAIGTLSYSGAEKIMYYMMKELTRRGHQVSVILISCDKAYENLDGIQQFPVFNKQDESTGNKFLRVFKRQMRIREVLKNNSVDLLVSFGVKFNLDVAQACIGLNLKRILCERNDPVYDPASRILRLRRDLIYPTADAFVFQTEQIKAFFSKDIQQRSVVIPNFIEKTVDPEHIKVARRDSFATCARLDDNQKNQSGLIRAFAKFSAKYPGYKLEFFGDGPDRAKYEALIAQLNLEDSVILHGRVSDPMREIEKCRFFVLSSKYEGMPNALIEAMAYGIPCISTDCGGGGAKALIQNGVNGLLVPYDDADAMANAMAKLAADPEFAEKIGKQAYLINDTLEMNGIIDQWESLFLRMVKK